MELLTAEHWSQVRAAIGIEVDDVDLPDTVITMSIFLGRARSAVKTQDPLWETRVGDAWSHLENAVVYFTAANIVMSFTRNDSETFGTLYKWTRTIVPAATLATALAAQGQDEIDLVLNPDVVDDDERPIMFTLGNECWTGRAW